MGKYSIGEEYKSKVMIMATNIVLGNSGSWEIETKNNKTLGALGQSFTLHTGTICEVIGYATKLAGSMDTIVLYTRNGNIILVDPGAMQKYFEKVNNNNNTVCTKQTNDSLWNSKCKYCGADAYESLFSVECSKGCNQ